MKREQLQEIRRLIRVISDADGNVTQRHQIVLNVLGSRFCPFFKETYKQAEVFSHLGDGVEAIKLLTNIAKNNDHTSNWVYKYDY